MDDDGVGEPQGDLCSRRLAVGAEGNDRSPTRLSPKPALTSHSPSATRSAACECAHSSETKIGARDSEGSAETAARGGGPLGADLTFGCCTGWTAGASRAGIVGGGTRVVSDGGTALALDAGGAAGISDAPIDIGLPVVEVSNVLTNESR